MITYTSEIKPVRSYTAYEILSMSPAKLRKELTHLCAMEPDVADKIEASVGWRPVWSKMTTCQYLEVAFVWAYLESTNYTVDIIGIYNTLELMRIRVAKETK